MKLPYKLRFAWMALLIGLSGAMHAQITLLQDYQNLNSASIGTYKGIQFKEAGFSGLYPVAGTNGTEFWTVSDRGVNIDCGNANLSGCRPTYDKMYAFPSYGPKIHRIRINGGNIQILQTIPIRRPNGTAASGLLNPTGLGSTANEVPSIDTVMDCANFSAKTAPKDTFGIDSEGILVDKDGNFWLCEEGGPTIWKLNANGVLIKRYTPYGNMPGMQAVDVPMDTVFKYRKNNRGFEGIAMAPNGKIYAIIQSPVLYPNTTTGEGTRIHRILEIDPATNAMRMLVYLNDGIIGSSGSNQIRLRDWKIGDMAAINDSTFLVLEAAARGTSDIKRLYTININGATAVHSGLYSGVTLEALVDSAGLANNGIKPVKKTLLMDLLANAWPAAYDKAEGLAIINDSTIAICNDNDYGQTCPLADGLPIATTLKSHLIVYSLKGANKLSNFKFIPTLLSQGQSAISSTQTPYLVPANAGVEFTAILTAGDSTNNGYKMPGTPDGTGAFDNGNGTFTLLVNHEFGNTAGAVRAHGSIGSLVSKYIINKSTLAVESGSDLIQNVKLWNGAAYVTYNASNPSSLAAFNRFCSADLPAPSAFYNAGTGLGTQERIFMNGEEAGNEGRAFAHIATGANAGTTYELPYLGKFSWENALANPVAQNKTIVAGTDDATPGQVYIYIGTKTNTGTEIEKAGLSNGKLYGVAVSGMSTEGSTSVPAAGTTFTLVDLGMVRDSSGAALNNRSNQLGVTNFLRPEDGAWDPANPSDFYFNTTNAFTAPSRLWKLHFNNINNPEQGGTITAVLDGTEGQKMLDNMAFDNYGHILLQEDVGNNVHNGKIWQYTTSTDALKLLAVHDSSRFLLGGANYLTQDEESSGILDMESILGKGKFLLVDQAHYSVAGPQVEGGQILVMYNSDSYKAANGANESSSQGAYVIPAAGGVRTSAILTAGDMAGSYKMAGTPDGTGAFDNGNGTFTLVVNHEFGNTAGVNRAHGAKGAFISKWIINKSNLTVVSGSDLIQKVNLYTPGVGYTLFNPADTTPKKAFNRFCSADLPAPSAFYNAATGLGTQERIFMNGEEAGNEGRAFAHIVTGANAGTTYELPALGKFSWENSVANPLAQNKTIVAGTDDATPGQVYIYVGTKTTTGTEIDKAGLSNGKLFGVAVNGLATELSSGIPAANTAFTLVDLGNVKDSSGAALNTLSNVRSVTNFLRPEDGAWDPANPNDFYFVTTNAFTAPSRLWRLRFTDINNPENGGTITALLDGTEGQKMLDNLTLDKYGNVLMQEDVGNNAHLGRILQYNIASDSLKVIAIHDSTRFYYPGAALLTQDEEASGIIDAESILGPGMFLFVDQAHYGVAGEQVEGGQLNTLFNPATYAAAILPEINILGNGINIQNGSNTPGTGNNTDFGGLVIGGSFAKSFVIENLGGGTLTISNIQFTGTHAADFSLVNPPVFPLNLAVGANISLQVKVTPGATGNRTANILIQNNDANESAYTFALQANAVCNRPAASVLIIGKDMVCTGDSIALQANTGVSLSYQWLKDGNLINGASSQNYYAKSSGMYSVEVSNEFACKNTSTALQASVLDYPAKPVISRNGNSLASTAAASYQWYQNNVAIPGATSQYLTLLMKGSYFVKVKNAAGCESVASDTIQYIPTGIENQLGLNLIEVAPNPFMEQTNIKFNLNSNAFVKLEVKNILGETLEVLENKELPLGNHAYSFGGNAAGVYIILLQVDGKTINYRVVKH